MIELKNVNFSYSGEPVLRNFSLSVGRGECVCLWGPSGCGKTTVFRIIAGLETAESGRVIAPSKLSVVFQEDRLLPFMSLKKNIMLPLEKSDSDRVSALLVEAGLGEFETMSARDLSGGMSRRAAIVRAVAFCGDALILDEPFNGIDGDNKQKIVAMLHREVLDRGIPIIMATHVAEDAELLGAKIIKM